MNEWDGTLDGIGSLKSMFIPLGVVALYENMCISFFFSSLSLSSCLVPTYPGVWI